MDKGADQLNKNVEAYGWAVVKVDAECEESGYAYSVGLYKSFRHPEIIMFGLDGDVLQRVVNTIGEQVKAGNRFQITDSDERVLEGYRCAFRPVAPAAESAYMGIMIDYYGHDIPALQCIWPDRDGCFPWEAETTPEYRRQQPMLSDGPEPHTHLRPAI